MAPARLFLVSTPIGNLGDISGRALDTLRAVDFVACEDTRLTGRLLQRFAIKARLLAYHDHNAEKSRPELLRLMAEGHTVALVSDAGTPTISDPGYKLVRACIDAGLPVSAVPGPAAPIVALSLSGLPTDRFFFGGFLPTKRGERRRILEELKPLRATLIFFDAPRRLAENLGDALDILGDREAAVARELTKLFEEVRRGKLSELLAMYRAAEPPKGEAVVVIGPPEPAAGPAEGDLDAALTEALETASLKDAVRQVSVQTGLPRRTVYERALALRGSADGNEYEVEC